MMVLFCMTGGVFVFYWGLEADADVGGEVFY